MFEGPIASQRTSTLPEARRQAAIAYEAQLPSAKVAKLERHYISKAKKHNLSPQDLLHVLPHR